MHEVVPFADTHRSRSRLRPRLTIEYHDDFGSSDVNTLYFDCFSGISGDMTIGALLDLGVDFGYLKTEIGKLPLVDDSGFAADFDLRSSRVVRANISATKFDVVLGKVSRQTHAPSPGHGHVHPGAEADGHGVPEGHSAAQDKHHSHRKASQILDMIKASGLGSNVRAQAVAIFEKLAISEGKVHDVQPEDVEFHEVGGIDSIIDVVGAAIGLDALQVNRFLCSPINIGGGFIHCRHGVYPVPAPATVNLLSDAPLYSKHVDVELVTPTGAAILAATVDRYGPMDGFEIKGIGYGAGSKAFAEFPNCLRVFVGVEAPARVETPSARPVSKEDIVVIETNIDDMSAEELAYAAEKLLSMGALDVITMPVVMKKGRSGHLLQVLALPEHEELLSRMIFQETTSIGVRRRPMSRRVLEREVVTVETSHGKIGVKIARFEGRVVNISPEYEDCAHLARKTGLPFHRIRDDAVKSYEAIPTHR